MVADRCVFLIAGARLKPPVHPHSSLLRSESEGDSEDALFTWPDREKGKLLRHQNGGASDCFSAKTQATPTEQAARSAGSRMSAHRENQGSRI
ncbi:UNVERIFIED_CONTAM: hypothetical protein FKN15_037216 [Acipenser sinensis]